MVRQNPIKTRFDELNKFLNMCVALYHIEIPDLQLYMIFDELCENSLTAYQKWLVTRLVKKQYTPIGPYCKIYKPIKDDLLIRILERNKKERNMQLIIRQVTT